MKRNIPLYVLTAALLAVAVYLKSPLTAVAIVALWGVKASEEIFTRKNRDADIVDMQAAIAASKAKVNMLEKELVNMADRARTILGDY